MTVIKTDRFDAQRNRMADLEAPTPATEQYEYWSEAEGCSCHINPPCSFCTSQSEDDQ